MRNYNFYELPHPVQNLFPRCTGATEFLGSYSASFGDRQKDKKRKQISVEHRKLADGQESLNFFYKEKKYLLKVVSKMIMNSIIVVKRFQESVIYLFIYFLISWSESGTFP